MTTHSGPTLAERDGLRVIDCKSCGFAHLHPLPEAATQAAYYRDEFWQREKAGALDRIQERLEWWTAIHGDWLHLVDVHSRVGTLLDVGCGYGHFMRAAQMLGWDVTGIDASPYAIENAFTLVSGRDVRVNLGSWDATVVPVPFDCISALWFVEHIPDPLRFLRWAHGRLNNSGVLLIVVPNDFSDAQRRVNDSVSVKVHSWWVNHTHINYFTPVTLANLLGRAGFVVIDHLTSFPMEAYLAAGNDYTADDRLGAQLHLRAEEFDLGMKREDRITFYRHMARAGSGREIVMIARKV